MPTFLLFRGHRSVVQQCCVRLHSTSNNVAPAHAHYMPRIHTNTCHQEFNMAPEMENVPESFVFSSKDPTCCDLLRAFAHIAQQETTLLGPTMLRVVASVCTGLYHNSSLSSSSSTLLESQIFPSHQSKESTFHLSWTEGFRRLLQSK